MFSESAPKNVKSLKQHWLAFNLSDFDREWSYMEIEEIAARLKKMQSWSYPGNNGLCHAHMKEIRTT